MASASTAWSAAAAAPSGRPDDLWTCLASEEPDDGEGVFSVLNLDHDGFLAKLDQDMSAVCGRLAAVETQVVLAWCHMYVHARARLSATFTTASPLPRRATGAAGCSGG